MKKTIISLLFVFILMLISINANAWTEVLDIKEEAFSSAVSISTTPTVFTSSSTLLTLEEIKFWNYSADVIYINFDVVTSSDAAAASGIKVFQSSENNEFLSFKIDEYVRFTLTLAADSGSGSLRALELGRAP